MTQYLLLLFILFEACATASTDLDYNCTSEPLGVLYPGVTRYNANVNCGSLMLSTDVTSTPLISYRKAKTQAYYTIIMLDPDADCGNLSPQHWPDKCTSNVPPAPVRHYVVGNVLGIFLQKGSIGAGKVVSDYTPPKISSGSHRYGWFLFEQQHFVDYATLHDSPAVWDYEKFLNSYSVSTSKIASNYMILMLDPGDPTPAPTPVPTPPTPVPTPQPTLKHCNVGDVVKCPGLKFKSTCAGDQCCPDGSICPSARSDFRGCSKKKLEDCTGSIFL